MDSRRTKVAFGINGNRGDIAPRRKWLGKIAREAKRSFGMFHYLWILFGLFDSMNLPSLQGTKIDFAGYDFAFVNALILAKVMLVAEDWDIARGFEGQASRLSRPVTVEPPVAEGCEPARTPIPF